jgi:hypothetical protein
VLTFTRSLQVDGAAPLGLILEIEKINQPNFGSIIVLLAGVAAVAGIALPRRSVHAK